MQCLWKPTQTAFANCIFLAFRTSSQNKLLRVHSRIKKNILDTLTMVSILDLCYFHCVFIPVKLASLTFSHSKEAALLCQSFYTVYILYFKYRMFSCGDLNLSFDAPPQQSLKYVWNIFLPPMWPQQVWVPHYHSLRIWQQVASDPPWPETLNWPSCECGVHLSSECQDRLQPCISLKLRGTLVAASQSVMLQQVFCLWQLIDKSLLWPHCLGCGQKCNMLENVTLQRGVQQPFSFLL